MEKTQGLIVATFTPMNSDGSLRTELIPDYYRYLTLNGIRGIFLNGTTSEGYHLTREERMEMVEAWSRVIGNDDFRLFVFCGHLSVREAILLAKHAAGIPNVYAISLTGNFFQKAPNLEILTEQVGEIAAAAADKWVYYYHIPVLTGIQVSMTRFLEIAGPKIPNLAGIKFTHSDLEDMMMAQEVDGNRFDIIAGIDEIALASRSLGVTGYIGSTYNFMAPLFHQMFALADSGRKEEAVMLQKKAIRIIHAVAAHGYISSAKFLMGQLGIPGGPARLPNRQITEAEKAILTQSLDTLGFSTLAGKIR